jgi:hypothetical protein
MSKDDDYSQNLEKKKRWRISWRYFLGRLIMLFIFTPFNIFPRKKISHIKK